MKLVMFNRPGSDELFLTLLKALIGERHNSMIDLCCNEARMTKQLDFQERTYVDVRACSVGTAEQSNFVQADVLGEHEVFNRHYDVAFCLDGIEHLSYQDGLKLLERMERISDRQILFTPLGDYLVEEDNSDPCCHKSGWRPLLLPPGWASIELPQYHESLDIGAFFFWKAPSIEDDFCRVTAETRSL